jgi:hypothetical protein
MSQERWEAFLNKVAQRLEEICAEADPGFDALIAAEVLDPIPLASAMSEFHARMLSLEKKIDDSWHQLGLEDDALREKGRALRKVIERRSKTLQVKKTAKAARAVKALAEVEMKRFATDTKCTSCGAPLSPTVLHEPSNVTCGHCRAVAVARPGQATLMLFQGSCLHAFGEEAALEADEWLDDAGDDVEAHRRYWRAYARGYGACVPGWTEQKSKELAEAKLGGIKWRLSRG